MFLVLWVTLNSPLISSYVECQLLTGLFAGLQHGVDMNTSLTTFDGFPRDDIDGAQSKTEIFASL